MLEVITHPQGVRTGLGSNEARELLPVAAGRLEDIVLPSSALSSEDRLGIYANMYFWRLVDVLTEDFPAVRYILISDN